jgi:hypothetical protein
VNIVLSKTEIDVEWRHETKRQGPELPKGWVSLAKRLGVSDEWEGQEDISARSSLATP